MTGTMAVLDQTGDSKIIWNSENEDEVAAARNQFNELVSTKKFAAYRVNRAGNKGEQIRKFDQEAEAIIMVPPMVGG